MSRRLAHAVLAIVCAPGLGGCLDVGGDALTVATAWTADERSGFERSVRGALPDGLRIRWLLLAPGDDLGRVARRRDPPDLLLGGLASTYEAIAALDLFEGRPAWMVARRSSSPPVNLTPAGLKTPDPVVAFDDPRRDPVSLAWAESVLRSAPWAEGYAKLFAETGKSRPPGRQPGASHPDDDRPEGVAAVRGARHSGAARALLSGLAELGVVRPPPPASTRPEARSLLADLLGATLVDAHDELTAARVALAASTDPERPKMWMTQPPPWPPASVARILERDRNAMPLLETLASQIAPEADVRAWLLRSWIAPPRSVDGALLDDLAGAAGGRLAREPRFRSWLRAEWTAWARQRYRRVARQAGGWKPRPPALSATGATS